MKKNVIVIICYAVILLWLGMHYQDIGAGFTGKVMGVTVLSKDKLLKLTGGRTECDPTPENIQFNNHAVIYDQADNLIFLSQDLYHDGIEGTLSVEQGELYWEKAPALFDKKKAMEEGVQLGLLWMQGDRYSTYRVLLTGMPLIDLTVTGGHKEESAEGERSVKEVDVRVEDPYRGDAAYQTAKGQINVRGGSSREFAKKSYKLELTDKKRSLLGMRKDDDWILNSLADDAGLIHNKLSFDVWERMSGENAVTKDRSTRLEYAEVFIDHTYRGVYGLMERIDAKQLSLSDGDILYKCRSARIPEEHNYTNEMTDGMRPVFLMKYPKNETDSDWEPIKRWVNIFCKEEFDSYEEAVSGLDLDNALEYNLYCLLVDGTDNTRKNIFFVAERQPDGAYKMKKVPWDLNCSWGSEWTADSETNNSAYSAENMQSVLSWCTDISTLYYYDPARTGALLSEKWEQLRKSVFTTDYLYAVLDRQFAYLHGSGAYERDRQINPSLYKEWDDRYVYEYIEGRLQFMDGYIYDLQYGGTPAYIYDGVDYSAEFDPRYYWERHEDDLEEFFEKYDVDALLENYVHVGKERGWKAKMMK